MKFIIRVEKKEKLIDEAFEEMGKQGLLRRMQISVYSAIYKSKLRGLFKLLRSRLKEYIATETEDSFEAIEEGDYNYVKEQRRRFEVFMFGTEKQLNNNKEYESFKNDRSVNKIIRLLKRGTLKTKSWAINTALGEGNVISFFIRSGIQITWRIRGDEKVKRKV